jgi:hypothetical protein
VRSVHVLSEVGLALKLARGTAKARLGRSARLEQVLPETLALWQQGRLDERRVAAICDAHGARQGSSGHFGLTSTPRASNHRRSTCYLFDDKIVMSRCWPSS